MTQEELEKTYLNKWVVVTGFEIEQTVEIYHPYAPNTSKPEYQREWRWTEDIIEGVVKEIDLYNDEAHNYHYLEIKLLIPYQETVYIITYFDNIQVDILKTLKRKKQYIRSKKHARISK